MGQVIIGEQKPKPKAETILPETYRHTIVESRYIPHTSLLSHVPGTPTLVEYYRGSYGRDEEQHSFEPGSIETYASYKRVHNLILKLDPGNGNFNFNPEPGQVEHFLNGYILFDLTPNIGDLFIKDIGDGRAGLYTLIAQPEIFTIGVDKVYRFEARLIAVVTAEIMSNLNSKVLEELYYSKDSAVAGGNAVLTGSDYNLNKRLYDFQAAIVDDILANHYFWDEETIVVPNDQNDWLYDPYLAKFLSYTLPANLMGQRKKINLLNVNYYVDSRKMQEPLTIWDMFYRGDFSHPERYKQEFYTQTRKSMLNTRQYGNVFFSKMDRAIVIHKDAAKRNPYTFTGGFLPNGVPDSVNKPPMEGEKYTYFFSDGFYEGKGTDTEMFVWKMFKEKTIDKAELIKVLEGYWSLDDKSKLYMGGIYLGAIKTALVTNSSYT